MTIFPRRATQRALDELVGLVPENKLRRKVNDLNRRVSRLEHGQVVADEWEIAVVAAFAKCGHVEHERAFGGPDGAVVDIHFSGTVDGVEIDLLADVRAVSDSDAIEKNPVDEFFQEILAAARNLGIIGGILLEVGGETVGNPGRKKARLLLPIATSLADYVAQNIQPWLQEIAIRPEDKAEYPQSDPYAQFTLHYDPAERPNAQGKWLSFEAPYSINRNPLYNALQRKAEQLRDAGWTGLSGVVICDGGCAALAERGGAGFGCTEIVHRFFEIHPEIAFVDVLRIEESRHPLSEYEIKIVPRIFWNAYCSRTEQVPVSRLLEHVHANLPRPRHSPRTLHSLGDTRNIFYQGMSMDGNSIKMSARALAELLAHRLDVESFHRNLPWLAKYVGRALEDGKLIQAAHIERSDETDEDWIVFTFADDVAIAPFKIPDA